MNEIFESVTFIHRCAKHRNYNKAYHAKTTFYNETP